MSKRSLDNAIVQANVRTALQEDLGTGDVSAALIAPDCAAQARVVCRGPGVLCGVAWFAASFAALDADAAVQWHTQEGDSLVAGEVVCDIHAKARALLSAERTALNFLQTLSGTATITQQYVAAIAGSGCKILDTRKTLPGLRYAQKYAVRCGGGMNHRMGLYDAILIKENHIAAAGSIAKALQQAHAQASKHQARFIEIEVEDLAQLAHALAAGPDRIMLDNFAYADLQEAVTLTAGQCPLEASGNITLENIAAYAHTGVDFISIGALTKNVQALDLSLTLRHVDC